jgi:hypothetical protein
MKTTHSPTVFMGKEGGNKLTWTRTHACNIKIVPWLLFNSNICLRIYNVFCASRGGLTEGISTILHTDILFLKGSDDGV